MKEVLYFSTPWCGPCKMFSPVMEEVCAATGTSLRKINAEQQPDLARNYGITSVPTFIVMKGGEQVLRHNGMMPKTKLMEVLSS